MRPAHLDLDTLLETLLASLPRPDAEERQVVGRLYQMLAEGEPVVSWALAARLHLPVTRVEQILARWPNVHREDDGRISAFWGLSLRPTRHRLEVDGRALYAWCAWDGLFLPVALGRTARLESRCPVTGTTVRLTVAPDRIVEAEPADALMSFITRDAARIRENVLLHFCRYVHFFTDDGAAERWLAEHEGAFLLNLADAFELGRRKVRAQLLDAVPRA